MQMQMQTTTATMNEPSKWLATRVDRIFAVILSRFGNRWVNRWAGIPIESVKADWRKQLAFLDGETGDRAIVFALENVGAEIPISTEFAKLCKEFRSTQPVANLIYNPTPLDQEKWNSVKKSLAELGQKSLNSDWALRTLRRSMTENQITDSSIHCCIFALKNHDRLTEIPAYIAQKYERQIEQCKTIRSAR